MQSSYGSVVFSGNHFDSNVGTWGALAIQNRTFPVIINGNTFTRNQARERGGALALLNDDSLIDIRDNTFSENYALIAGGAIYADSFRPLTSLAISNSTFYNNSCSLDNGFGGNFD